MTTSAFALVACRMQLPQPVGLSWPSHMVTVQPTALAASATPATGVAQDTTHRLTPPFGVVGTVGGVPVTPW